VESVPETVALRTRSYELLGVGPGDRVADVGAGTGRAVAELAGLGLPVTGIDVSEQMIAVGRQRFPAADLRVGTAEALPFADGELRA
jgi:ubiquinone/menaquinone biosynthesis C-methylase UbiE